MHIKASSIIIIIAINLLIQKLRSGNQEVNHFHASSNPQDVSSFWILCNISVCFQISSRSVEILLNQTIKSFNSCISLGSILVLIHKFCHDTFAGIGRSWYTELVSLWYKIETEWFPQFDTYFKKYWINGPGTIREASEILNFSGCISSEVYFSPRAVFTQV